MKTKNLLATLLLPAIAALGFSSCQMAHKAKPADETPQHGKPSVPGTANEMPKKSPQKKAM